MAESASSVTKIPSFWWEPYLSNVTSQNGEDGILKRILEIVPPASRQCVEFGAWDGKKHSNTYRLLTEERFGGVLIEADGDKYQDLLKTFGDRPDIRCVKRFVEFEGPNSLDNILSEAGLPKEFEVLSIDIDGNDYHIWDSLRNFRPRVVVIEFNGTVPNHIEFVQPRDMRVNQGTSLRSIVKLAEAKGYRLVALTGNAIFVPKEYFHLFGIQDNSVEAMRPDPNNVALSYLFVLYDGTLVIEGNRSLIWEKAAFGPRYVQLLPACFRFCGKGGNRFLRLLKRLYLRYLWCKTGIRFGKHE